MDPARNTTLLIFLNITIYYRPVDGVADYLLALEIALVSLVDVFKMEVSEGWQDDDTICF